MAIKRLFIIFFTLVWFGASNHCFAETLIFGSKTSQEMPCEGTKSSGDSHKHGEQCTLVVASLSHAEQIGIKALSSEAPSIIPIFLFTIVNFGLEYQSQVPFTALEPDPGLKPLPLISLSIAQNAPPAPQLT